MARDEYVELIEEEQQVKTTHAPNACPPKTFSSRQREPIHAVHQTDSLSLYRTLIGAAALGLTQMVDKSSLNTAKAFGYFRNPTQRAYEALLPIAIQFDKALQSGNPYPRVRDMHSLSVTITPHAAELVVRFIYQNSRNSHTVFLIRIIPTTDVVQQFAETLRNSADRHEVEFSNRI